MKLNPNTVVWASFLVTDIFCLAFGLTVAVFAGWLKRSPRTKTLSPSMSKTVDIMIAVVRGLAIAVIILSAFLAYKLFRIRDCVFPGSGS